MIVYIGYTAFNSFFPHILESLTLSTDKLFYAEESQDALQKWENVRRLNSSYIWKEERTSKC